MGAQNRPAPQHADPPQQYWEVHEEKKKKGENTKRIRGSPSRDQTNQPRNGEQLDEGGVEHNDPRDDPCRDRPAPDESGSRRAARLHPRPAPQEGVEGLRGDMGRSPPHAVCFREISTPFHIVLRE